MELDIANAALELSVRFPAVASDEALAIFVKTHTELTNRINEQRRKLHDMQSKINNTVIRVVDNTLDAIPDAVTGVYGSSKYTKFSICKDETPWLNLAAATNGTSFMVRYETTRAYYDQRFPDGSLALTFSDLHTVVGSKEYLSSVRWYLRDICKTAGSALTNDLESFVATYLSPDERYLPAVRAAFVEHEGQYFAYVVWQ